MKILYIDCFFGFDASMLLGALIDAGACPRQIESRLEQYVQNPRLEVYDTQRMSIECKMARALCTDKKGCAPYSITEKYKETAGTDDIAMQAVICAIEELEIEYVMCSDMSLPDNTDGEVISILQSAGIELAPTTDDIIPPRSADAAFLVSISSEHGAKPDMDIISIGYGAGGSDTQKPTLVTATVGSFNPENLFLMQEESVAHLL